MKERGGMDELPAEDLCDACLSRPGSLRFTCAVTRAEAIETVRQWSASRRIAPSWRCQDWTAASCCLRSLPFWMLTAHVSGYVKGCRIESDDVSDIEIPMDVTLNNTFIWTWTASRSGAIGIWSLHNLSGETHLFRKDSTQMSDVTVPRAAALPVGIRAFPDAVLNYCNVPEITEIEVHIQDLEDAFVLYPFWMVRHASSDPAFFALIDGVTGNLVSARVPGDPLTRLETFLAATALSVLGVALSIYAAHYFLSNPSAFSPKELQDYALIAGAGLIAVFLLVWAFFVSEAFVFARYGSEITYGEVKGGYNTSQYDAISARTRQFWPGIIFSFAATVSGGFLFMLSCDWQAAALGLGGLVMYLGLCMWRLEVGRMEDLIDCGYVIEDVS